VFVSFPSCSLLCRGISARSLQAGCDRINAESRRFHFSHLFFDLSTWGGLLSLSGHDLAAASCEQPFTDVIRIPKRFHPRVFFPVPCEGVAKEMRPFTGRKEDAFRTGKVSDYTLDLFSTLLIS